MASFRSVVYQRGAAEGVAVVELPRPTAARPGHVLVEVRACGVNPVDAKYCTGDKLPEWIPERWRRWTVEGRGAGFDFAGVALDVPGDGSVVGIQKGDKVFGSMPPMQASFAQLCEVPEHQVAVMPSNLDFPQAAALPLVGTTAMQALKYRHGLRSGQRLLVIGASGGVGTFAVQIGRHLVGKEGHVAAVCSARNFNLVRGLGANAVFDYGEGLDKLMEDLKAAYPETPFDLVLDCVSSLEEKDRVFDYNARIHAAGTLLKEDLNAPETSKSNYVTIGGSSFDWFRALLRRTAGWNWFSTNHELFWIVFPQSRGVLEELKACAERDELSAVIEEIQVHGFESCEPVRDAFRRLHGRRVQGKLVLVL